MVRTRYQTKQHVLNELQRDSTYDHLPGNSFYDEGFRQVLLENQTCSILPFGTSIRNKVECGNCLVGERCKRFHSLRMFKPFKLVVIGGKQLSPIPFPPSPDKIIVEMHDTENSRFSFSIFQIYR